MGRRHIVANTLLLFCLLFAAPISVAAGGAQVPRWTDANVADLIADLNALLRGQHRMQSISQGLTQVTAIERQKQLLGVSDDAALEDVLAGARQWWKDNIQAPAFRIANNPAARCSLAQIVLTKLLAAERQSQLLGMDTSADVDPTNPNSLFSQALVAVKQRCLEHAFDACMDSGNGQHLVMMLAGAVRQFQLLAIDDADFEAQAVYLYRRCTVYQLRYHSRTRVDGTSYVFGTTQDGSVILLSDVNPASGLAGLSQDHEWNGPRPVDPLDVLQSTTECTARRQRITCGPPDPRLPARAKIKARDFEMKRYFDEVTIVEEGSATDPQGFRSRVESNRKSDGTDALVLTFDPPLLMTMATLTTDNKTIQLPMVPSKIGFLSAHGRATSQDIELPGWNRVGNNVLFEKAISGQQTNAKTLFVDTSRFELVHRPDLFPPEEIVSKWELTPASEGPSLNRNPAQPIVK